MTSRVRAVLILAALFLSILVVTAALTYSAVQNWRVDDLDRRVNRLETDVSLLRE